MVFRLFCLCFLLTNVIAWQFRRNAQERMMLNREALLPGGFEIQPTSNKSLPRTKHPIAVHSVEELKRLIRGGYGVQDVDVRGDVCDLVHTNQTKLHPVVKLFHERKRAGSTAGNRKDNHKLAIAIEGGGMRGCVGAGMITVRSYAIITQLITSLCDLCSFCLGSLVSRSH